MWYWFGSILKQIGYSNIKGKVMEASLFGFLVIGCLGLLVSAWGIYDAFRSGKSERANRQDIIVNIDSDDSIKIKEIELHLDSGGIIKGVVKQPETIRPVKRPKRKSSSKTNVPKSSS